MTKTAIAVRHVHFEDLGAFGNTLRRHGYDVRYCDAGLDDIGGLDPLAPDLIIVLGGPIGAYQELAYPFLGQELALLERRLAAAQPTLGICLGAQLMARAAGARVYPGPAKEIGWGELQLSGAAQKAPLHHFAGVPVLHWHGDTFDLPAGAELSHRPKSVPTRLLRLADTHSPASSIPKSAARVSSAGSLGTRSRSAGSGPDGRSIATRYRTFCAERGAAFLSEWLSGLD